MALQYAQLLYNFKVNDSGSSQNNKLDFKNGVGTYAATLNAGIYTADEFAAEVQRAMRVQTNDSNQYCVFNYDDATVAGVITLGFGLTGAGTFELLFGTGTNHATSCHGLLGFQDDGTSATDKTGTTFYTSTSSVGGTYSTAKVWTLAEPLQANSPLTAASIGTNSTATAPTALANGTLLQRIPRIIQNTTDGGLVEPLFLSELKQVQLTFDQLTAAEQIKMESFLDWAVRGYRFTFQPDKTSPNGLKLAMDVRQVTNAFTWLTNPTANYGSFTFHEQPS